jgi:hypothetical protein
MSTFRVLLRLLPLVAFPLACSSEDPSPDEPRQVVTAMLAGAVVGIPYQQPLEADCPAGSPPVWGITTGGLPPGLTIQGSLIVGTPTQEGAFSFTVIVTCHGTGTRALSLAVAPAADLAITIPDASGTLPPGRIGVPYQVQLTAAGNRSGAISWTIRPGSALPPGLELSTTGMITGTPQGLPGTADFTLEARQGELVATREASIVLGNPVLRIMVPPGGIPDGIESVFDSVALHATGGTGPYQWSLPEPPAFWARVDQEGMLRFIPNLGATQLRVRVTSGADTDEVVLPIRAGRNTSAITFGLRSSDFAIDARATVGSIIVPLAQAATGGVAPYTWDSFGFPGGLVFRNTEHPHFLGTASVGRYEAVYTITDASGGKMSSPATIGIVNDLIPGSVPQPYIVARGDQVLLPVPLLGGWNPLYCPLYFGALPPGLTLARISDTPVIVGTAREPGTWSVVIQCNDSSNIYDPLAVFTWYQETWVTLTFEVR